MKRWWRRRPLKLRLALWFTLVASLTLLALLPVVYGLIEHRLHVEMDRQLRTDWAQARGRLSFDAAGAPQWRGPRRLDVADATGPWFDVWSGAGNWLYGQQPDGNAAVASLPPPAADAEPRFRTLERDGRELRSLTMATRVGDRDVVLQVYRDEDGIHHTLREILVALSLSVPFIALFAAAAGYFTAGRVLRPIGAMADEAQRIGSESLDRRLPVPHRDDELGRLATAFNDTLQRLQGSFDSLRRFTADASHELRTPLTALRTVGEVSLRDPTDGPALREAVGSMLEEAGRLDDLIESLLLLARTEGGATPRPEPVPLHTLLEELRDTVAVLAAEKRQDLQIAGDAAWTATGEPLLIRHALMNVLFNAIRYSPPGIHHPPQVPAT